VPWAPGRAKSSVQPDPTAQHACRRPYLDGAGIVSESVVCSQIARECLRLHLAGQVGPILFDRLISHFGSLDAILGASVSRLRQVEGIGEKTAEAIASVARSEAVERELAEAEQLGVRVICREDPSFPEPLRYIPDPPICLYVLGTWQREDALSLGIVGSRRPTYYGVEQAERFATMLTRSGLTIVSGMARGIDEAAHRAALRAGGRTIAVLGCGLATCYPPESVALRDQIAASGAVLSELPLQAPPEGKNFPRRNRLIAGLTLGTLVVEAGRRSGALVTARLANEYNREVFAVPGRVDVLQAQGTNTLIRDGQAKLVMELGDILDELGEAGELLQVQAARTIEVQERAEARRIEATQKPRLDDSELAVYEALGVDPVHIEQIAQRCGLEIAEVTASLTMLQIKGLAKQLPGNAFVRRGGRKS